MPRNEGWGVTSCRLTLLVARDTCSGLRGGEEIEWVGNWMGNMRRDCQMAYQLTVQVRNVFPGLEESL